MLQICEKYSCLFVEGKKKHCIFAASKPKGEKFFKILGESHSGNCNRL